MGVLACLPYGKLIVKLSALARCLYIHIESHQGADQGVLGQLVVPHLFGGQE